MSTLLDIAHIPLFWEENFLANMYCVRMVHFSHHFVLELLLGLTELCGFWGLLFLDLVVLFFWAIWVRLLLVFPLIFFDIRLLLLLLFIFLFIFVFLLLVIFKALIFPFLLDVFV